MKHTHRLAAAATGFVFLTVGASAVAISAADQAPLPPGQEPQVTAPSSAPPSGSAATSAERSGELARPSVSALLEDVGLNDPRLVREADGFRVYLSKTKAVDSICLTAENVNTGRLTSSCQIRDTLKRGHLWVGIGGTAESVQRMVGAAPDGVREVLLTDDAGVNQRVPVIGNVYLAREEDAQSFKRIEWTATDGSTADLRLPATE